MSIQASLNQLLGTAAIGAGLYSQTPGAKEKAEINSLQRRISQTQALSEKQMEESDFPTSPEAREALGAEAKATQRLAELKPTEENIKQAAKSREVRDTIEQLHQAEIDNKALQEQKRIQEQRKNQATAIDERKIFTKQLDELRAAGAISNKEAKSLAYKFNKFGGEK